MTIAAVRSRRCCARADNFLGQVRLSQGDNGAAAQLFTDGLTVARRAEDRISLLVSLYDLALTSQAQGDLAGAAGHLKEGLALAAESGDEAGRLSGPRGVRGRRGAGRVRPGSIVAVTRTSPPGADTSRVRAGLCCCCHLVRGLGRRPCAHWPRLVRQPWPQDNSSLPTWIVGVTRFQRSCLGLHAQIILMCGKPQWCWLAERCHDRAEPTGRGNRHGRCACQLAG